MPTVAELAQQELSRRYSLQGRTQVAPRIQTMQNARPTVRSALSNLMRDAVDATGLEGGYRQGLLNAAGGVETAVDFLPVVGDVLGLEDASRAYGQGDMVGAGINMMGVVPIIGDVAAKGAQSALRARGVMGDDLLNIIDLAEEIAGKGGKIDNDGMVTLYHATDRESADIISNSGTMYGKEDRLFFSTKPDGQISGYGDAVIETKIPLEDLSLDDIFSDEAHLTINNKSGLGGSTPIRAKVLSPSPAVGEMMGVTPEVDDDYWYHGTNSAEDFDEFDPEKLGSASGARDAKLGFYHGRKRETASAYVNSDDWSVDEFRQMFGDGAEDPELLQQIRDANPNKAIDDILQGNILHGSNWKGPITIPEGRIMKNKIDTSNYKTVDVGGEAWDEAMQTSIGNEAMNEGYDGVIFQNMQDSGWFGGKGADDIALSFNPKNITRANNGEALAGAAMGGRAGGNRVRSALRGLDMNPNQ